MKTPREVLLQRHQWIDRKLDSVREHVIATAVEKRGKPAEKGVRQSSSLLEFLRPLRWHLAGMTAAWILVAVLNIDRPSSSPATRQASASPRQLLAELRENRRQILELVESSVTQLDPGGPALPAPPSFVPRRRSEAQFQSAVV